MLYLLGQSYKELPFSLSEQLPEMMFEEVIRETPASDLAGRAYAAYSELVTLAYTGSEGTDIPDDVKRIQAELYNLAFPKKQAAPE